ncbi:MAG: S8 family serine peptidase [Actinomycetota bacterium]|nr:S8 family serine peptidase [Actinomycetota bacterium]
MRSRLTVLVGAAAVVLATVAVPAGSTSAQPGPRALLAGRYVVLMAADPVAERTPRGRLTAASPRVRQHVGFLHRQHDRVLRGADVEQGDVSVEYSYALNGFAAELSRAEAEAMSRQRGVVAVVKDRLRQVQTDNTPAFLGLSDPAGPWESDLVGEDVVVGVIDTGIWPEHPSFEDDGSFGPLAGQAPVPCELGNVRHNPDDVAFDCNNKLLGARDMRITYKRVIGPERYDSARDDDGHGTHTASTAAGNADVDAQIFGIDRGRLSGVAPRARVIAYKACGEQGCIESDLAAAIDRAVLDGVDVINYSIGGGAGLVGPDEVAFLAAADSGVFVATSAGNAGPGPSTVGGPSSAPWVTSVAASTQDRTFQGSVTLGNARRFTGASITDGTDAATLVDAATLGNELCLVGQPFSATVTGAVVLCKRGENARVDKSRAVFDAGGAGMVLYDESDAAALVTDNHWVPSVHISNSDGLVIKRYIARTGGAATAQITGGERVASQGSAMADFSSRGPNPAAADIIKPDITAPGVNILAGNSPTPALGAPGELFQSISGTSMSSPHIAGIYALLKQAHPDWTPAMAKSAIMTTARQNVVKEDGSTRADPFDLGAGHVRPGSVGADSVFDPGLVYDAGTGDYLAFLCGADPTVFRNPDRSCAALEAAGFSTDPRDLNYPSIGVAEVAGTQTVARTVTSVAGTAGPTTYTADVQAPRGFDVSVSPAQVTLRPGQSAAVDVTITNAGSAAVGRWRFGSLTWSGGGYSVRSPIAAAASTFDAPALVEEGGATGRAGFPVQFGYTGGYRAQAHGLAPLETTAGTVRQDPDQTFDPADATGTTRHRFVTRGLSYLRWELTHPGRAVDLDVYLADARGQVVASSTNGGTDEMVEVALPRRGPYTLFVHGWQTGGPRTSYTLRSWQVPAGTAGSLDVASAPQNAVLGRRGRVAVAWTGAVPGSPAYFGAVSHHRGSRVVGLTVVRVTPRR